MFRPDNRPAEVVWKFFDEAFEKTDYPSLGWALGSDWGMGSGYPITPRAYRDAAADRMTILYGPHPLTRST